MLKGKNILLGITGGIAAYKIPLLIRLLVKEGAHVKVVATPSALDFVSPLTLSTLSKNPVLTNFKNESNYWNNHVELALWADFFVVAPATANTIAKFANGICDNFLLACYFSAKCPILVAPAMDLDMYQHPTLKNNLKQLKKFGNKILDAPAGELASGLSGEGRMEEPELIFEAIKNHFEASLPLKGKKILITAGPTVEKIDPVRFISNFSTGKMGIALAEHATNLGADVNLVIGPTKVSSSELINRVDVVTAEDMYNAVHQYVKNADIIIMAAAVADFTPATSSDKKIKKTEQTAKTNELVIELKPTKDILASVGKIKNKNQLLIGFALETHDELENAKNKLAKKNLDYIVLNSLNDKGAGFNHETNKITLIDKNNNIDNFELKSKVKVAEDIFNIILTKHFTKK